MISCNIFSIKEQPNTIIINKSYMHIFYNFPQNINMVKNKNIFKILLFFNIVLGIFTFFCSQHSKCLAIKIQDYENLEHYFDEEPGFETIDIETKQTNSDVTPSRNYTIVIDPGHGGTDPGSIGYKTKVHEDELNLAMSKKLEKKLEQAGFNVVMTRKDNNALIEGKGKKWKREEMEARRDLIEKTRPNMIISLHQNSYTNHSLRGAQVFYDKKSEISKEIATSIQEQFKLNLDKSIKAPSPGDYFMLKCSSAPSVIVECGFLSHPEEEKLLQTDEYQDKIISSIYLGIVNFFQNK